MRKTTAIAVICLLSLACGRHSAKINGHIDGIEGCPLRLEKVAVGKVTPLDSVRLSTSGKFSFTIKDVEPATFYQLTLDTLGSLMLLAHEGEHVHLQAHAGNLISSAQVGGSQDAELLVQLQQNSVQINRLLDSLLSITAATEAEQINVRRGINRLFVRQKQYNTRFILTHPTSPSSMLAYYQKFGKQASLFGTADDRFLLRALADSMRAHYPKSTYTKSLLTDLDVLEGVARREAMQGLMNTAAVLDKPEIELPDMQGKMHNLSALKGKVVLLDFWASTNKVSLMDNRELLTVYKEYHKNGFEVFQVSLDEGVAEWEASVMQQALPWISVHCNVNEGCIAAQSYVVQKLPANYLINRKGEIVGKNLYGDELKKKVKELLK